MTKLKFQMNFKIQTTKSQTRLHRWRLEFGDILLFVNTSTTLLLLTAVL